MRKLRQWLKRLLRDTELGVWNRDSNAGSTPLQASIALNHSLEIYGSRETQIKTRYHLLSKSANIKKTNTVNVQNEYCQPGC